VQAGTRGAGEAGGLGEVAQESGLVAHGGQDAASQAPVCCGLGEAEGLDEVPLSEAMQAAVVGCPGGQQRRLGDCGEQLAADIIGVAAP
jgi:hypothetical protein